MAIRTGDDCTMRFHVPGSRCWFASHDSRATEPGTLEPGTSMIPTVTISARGEGRLQSGHPWIYRTEIKDATAAGGARVLVRSARGGRPLGSAFYSDRSQIALRMLTRGDVPAADALIRQRIESALAFRQSLAIDATAFRLVHGEADLLPSIIVDRYGDYLVVQTLSQGA